MNHKKELLWSLWVFIVPRPFGQPLPQEPLEEGAVTLYVRWLELRVIIPILTIRSPTILQLGPKP